MSQKQALREGERLYRRAAAERTPAAIQDATLYLRQLIEALPPGDLDRAFELTRRLHEMQSWTPRGGDPPTTART